MHPLLPYGIMGIMAFIAALLCLLLPETRFKPTLENIDQEIQESSTGTTDAKEKEDDEFSPGTDEKKAFYASTTSFISTV